MDCLTRRKVVENQYQRRKKKKKKKKRGRRRSVIPEKGVFGGTGVGTVTGDGAETTAGA
jgi:hypothetical protein